MEDKHNGAACSPCLEAWKNVRKWTGQKMTPTAGLCLLPVPWVKMLFHHLLTLPMRNTKRHLLEGIPLPRFHIGSTALEELNEPFHTEFVKSGP